MFIGIVIVITGDVIDGGGGFFSLAFWSGEFCTYTQLFYLFSPRSSYGKRKKKDILGAHDTQNAGRVIQFLHRF